MNRMIRGGLWLVAGVTVCGGWLLGQTPAEAPSATHRQTATIGLSKELSFAALGGICLDRDGNLLAGDMKSGEVRVIEPGGKLRATWKPGLSPRVLEACSDGTVFVGGVGALAKLDKDGKAVKAVKADSKAIPNSAVAGIAAGENDVFVSFGRGDEASVRGVVIRFTRELEQPKVIVTGLTGCCGRMAIATRDGELYVAENARFRINRYDREGKLLTSWGRGDRTALDGFGSCCNPMGIGFGPGGELFTSESGLDRIKRYQADGKFLGLVGNVQTPSKASAERPGSSCYNTAIAISKDGRQVYVVDENNNCVHVLSSPPTSQPDQPSR